MNVSHTEDVKNKR